METSERLLEAAASVCAEHGFDGCTLARVAERASVSPTAVYNHFASREDLIYAAAVHGLDKLTTLAVSLGGGLDAAPTMAVAYLRPEMRETRRLLAEVHVASARDEKLAQLLGDWHRSWASVVAASLPADDPAPLATVKTMFLVLLGLCHFDDVAAVRAPRAAVEERVELVMTSLASIRSTTP